MGTRLKKYCISSVRCLSPFASHIPTRKTERVVSSYSGRYRHSIPEDDYYWKGRDGVGVTCDRNHMLRLTALRSSIAVRGAFPRTSFSGAEGQTRAVATHKIRCGGSKGDRMRGVKKENLPSKVCVTCNRPFTWRKKWERCWDEVTTCSKRCNAERRAAGKSDKTGGGSESGDEPDPPSKESGVRRERNNAPNLSVAAEPSSIHSEDSSVEVSNGNVPDFDAKAERKAAKKAQKAARRAQREGRGDGGGGQKACDSCSRMSDLLIRCTTDESGVWRMVCGRCWQTVSGGVPDGDVAHPHYRYGGLWKNRRAATEPSTTPPTKPLTEESQLAAATSQ